MQETIDNIYETASIKQDAFDFSADKRIDINNLHTEIQLHSEKCFKYNARRSKLQAVVNQLEELKKQTRSELINECIANPKLCDPSSATPKYTDKKAESYYRLNSGYKEVITALLDAKHELDCMAGMQRIIEEMKWDLKDLVALSMSQYFESKESKETRIVEDVQFDSVDKSYPKKEAKKEIPEEKEIKEEPETPEKPVEKPEPKKNPVTRSRRRSR